MQMDVSSSRPSNKAIIFLGLIEYELNSLLGAPHLVDYISVHIRFDLERYLLNIYSYIYITSRIKVTSGKNLIPSRSLPVYSGRHSFSQIHFQTL